MADAPHRAVIRDDGRVVVRDPEAVYELAGKGYGRVEGEVLTLSHVEALYLVKKGDLVVTDPEGNAVDFRRLLLTAMRGDPDIWTRLEVYTDLRRRGLQPRPGYVPGISFLVDRRTGDGTRRYLIVGIKEGGRISFKDLERVFAGAVESRRELVLALIDKEGNISYYIVNKFM